MYDYDCDGYEPRKVYIDSIERIVENEVQKRLTDKQKQLEKDYQYYKDEMWKAKNQLSKIKSKLANHEKEVEKITRESVKMAQREYWFDCAIGDKVYLVDYKLEYPKCEKCNNTQHIKVIVDGIEVKAECPICGNYSKKQSRYTKEYFVNEVVISRLQIEIYKDKKWIKLWFDNDNAEREYEIEYYKIYKTKEEAEEELRKMISEDEK